MDRKDMLVAKLLNENADLNWAISAYSDEMDAMYKYETALEAQRDSLHDEVLKLRAEVTEDLEAIGILHAALDDLSDEYDEIYDELQGFRNEAPFYKDLEERNAAVEKENVALRRCLKEWRAKAFELMDKLNEKNGKEN